MTTRSPYIQPGSESSLESLDAPHIAENFSVAASELSELQANRKMHKQGSVTLASAVGTTQSPSTTAALDLSGASINSNNVQRLTPRTQRRSLAEARMERMLLNAARATRNPGTAPKSPAKLTKAQGVFTNPHFRYQGGPISKLITFFANVLKFI